MQKLTNNFSLNEFVKVEKPPIYIVENYLVIASLLERVRAHFNKPIRITSGYRTPEENVRVGGSPNSLHLKGRACDFVIDITPQEALIIPSLIPVGEFILYVSPDHKKITHIHYALPSVSNKQIIVDKKLWTYEGKKTYYDLRSFA